MPDFTTFSTRYVDRCAAMLARATRQRRTALRALLLTMGLVLVSGRSMISRMLVVMGWHRVTGHQPTASSPHRVSI